MTKSTVFLLPRCFLALVIACTLLACQEKTESGPTFDDLERYREDAVVGHLIDTQLAGVQQAPDGAESWVQLGIAFEANDFLAEAAISYRHALTLGGNVGRTWYRLGSVLDGLSQNEAAAEAFTESLQLVPDYPPTYWRRGFVYSTLGRNEQAVQDFRQALEQDSNQFPATLGLAQILLRSDDLADAEEVVTLLEPLHQQFPQMRHARTLLGLAYRKVGRLEEAREHLEAGARGASSAPVKNRSLVFSRYVRDPWQREMKDARASYRMVLNAARQSFMGGDLDGAIETLEQLRPHRPDDVTLGLNLASVYRQAQRRQDAIALLQELLERHPQRYHLAMDLAWNLYEDDQQDAALRMAERAAAIDPESTGPDRLRATIEGTLPPPALQAPGQGAPQPILIPVQGAAPQGTPQGTPQGKPQ